MTGTYTDIEPVTFRVIGGALETIADGMSLTLYRLAGSSIMREMEDVGTALTDAQGRELCEGDTNPMHAGATPYYVQGILSRLGGQIRKGDIILHNDAYRGATHTNDAGITIPIFWEGELVAFAVANGHLMDIGSANVGSAADAKDVFAEGTRYYALRLYREGVLNDDLWHHILYNVRTPRLNKADIEAMIAACEYGKSRLLELFRRYGFETTMGAAHGWMDYSESRLRAMIREVPDGEYRAPTAWLDDDGVNRGKRLRVEVSVRVKDDSVEIDLTGSNPEVPTGCNVPFEGSTLTAINYIVRTILLDEARTGEHVPQNAGMARPITVICPEGTIFRPRFPRASTSRFCQIQRIADSVILALAEVIPEYVTAGNSAHSHVVAYAGFDHERGEYWVFLEVVGGSYGGRFGKDGLDSVDVLLTNTRNNPIEYLEMAYPLRCERFELRDQPPGAGKWRGGKSTVRAIRMLTDGEVSVEGDRHTDPPAGVLGGLPGRVARVVKNPGSPSEEEWPSKLVGQPMRAGDILLVEGPNAGGYGDPLERDPQLVLEDVLDEFISVDDAREDYGVVIDPQTRALDAHRTRELRNMRRQHGS